MHIVYLNIDMRCVSPGLSDRVLIRHIVLLYLVHNHFVLVDSWTQH
jgi:hypothetical protein